MEQNVQRMTTGKNRILGELKGNGAIRVAEGEGRGAQITRDLSSLLSSCDHDISKEEPKGG